ncbi:MAG: YkgJ family cysteine cluster protein [Xanthomonadales bacterium]|nr:YkgJ family cysteine cluster protein [Xanthomonadales bacterium]
MDETEKLREQARQATRAMAPARPAAGDLERARRGALRVLDGQLARLPSAVRGQLACRRGCALCCHLRVAVTAVEVLALAAYIRSQLDEAGFVALRERIADSAAQLHALPTGRLFATNLPCPLLAADGACSMYAARPFNCRAYHSLDYAACLASFQQPEDATLGHPRSVAVARVHAGVQQGLREAGETAGTDTDHYELVTALAEALGDPGVDARFAAGETAFRTALRL